MSFNKKEKIFSKANYLIGRKSVIDGLLNNLPIKQIFLLKSDQTIESLAKQNNIKIEMHSLKWFQVQIQKNFKHQGVVALVDIQNITISIEQLLAKVKDKPKSLIVVLDGIKDPGNFGAILRTCLAANVDGVIFKNDNQAPINSYVIKSSMGALFYLNLVKVSNLRYAVDKFKKAGFWSVVSCLNDNAENYKNFNVDKGILILGNEDQGVSKLLLSEADYKVKIPINKKVDSLNVSVAAGLLIFELISK